MSSEAITDPTGPDSEFANRPVETVLRRHPDGRPMVIAYSYKFPETPDRGGTKIQAFDPVGNEIFDHRREMADGYHHGFWYETIAEMAGVPHIVMSHQVASISYDRLSKKIMEKYPELRISEPTDSPLTDFLGMGMRRETLDRYYAFCDRVRDKYEGDPDAPFIPWITIYDYDQTGRPAGKRTYRDVTYITDTALVADQVVLFPITHEEYEYDSNDRIRLVTIYSDDTDNRSELSNMRAYESDELKNGMLRCAEYWYRPVNEADLTGGVTPWLGVVRIVDPETGAHVSRAVYKMARHPGEMLSLYEQVKKFPGLMSLIAQNQTGIQAGYEGGVPSDILLPSWILPDSFPAFSNGARITDIGTRGDLTGKRFINYMRDFLIEVKYVSALENLMITGQLVTGVRKVVSGGAFQMLEEANFEEIVGSMDVYQRLAVAAAFLSVIREHVRALPDMADRWKNLADLAVQLVGLGPDDYRQIAELDTEPLVNYPEALEGHTFLLHLNEAWERFVLPQES